LPDDQVLDVLGRREEEVLDAVQAPLPFGHPDRDAVVGPDRLHFQAEAIPQS
jgi:hypothetical protein